MNNAKSKDGFNLVELMLAMLATAVLALVVGGMLCFGWMGWVRNNDSVNMQRDASLAMRVMAREIRSSTKMRFAGSALECENAGGTTRFIKSGNNLDMEVEGRPPMHLIREVVQSFTPVPGVTTGSVELMVQLATGNDTSTITDTVFYSRN